jgi:hypothetical protein
LLLSAGVQKYSKFGSSSITVMVTLCSFESASIVDGCSISNVAVPVPDEVTPAVAVVTATAPSISSSSASMDSRLSIELDAIDCIIACCGISRPIIFLDLAIGAVPPPPLSVA